MPIDDNVVFKNYKVYYPMASPTKGYRLLLLVREDLAARSNPTMIKSSPMEIWIRLDLPSGPLALASIYRQWGGVEEDELLLLHDSIREFTSKFNRTLILGDWNLDLSRIGDSGFYRRKLLKAHMDCLEECGLSPANVLDMSPTFYSHGVFDTGDGSRNRKTSILDHVYLLGLPQPSSFEVLPIVMTDHRPTLTKFDLNRQGSVLKTVAHRNFKSLSATALCWAINAEALSRVFSLEDVEEIHEIIVREITVALDLVAPLEQVQIKERKNPLYLSAETRSLIRERDRAAAGSNHNEYRRLRNKVARLVRRDKLASNAKHLQEQGFNPKSVWSLANSASGRSQGSALPARIDDEEMGHRVEGDAELADCMNRFYISKIEKIRASIGAGEEHHGDQQQQQQQHQDQEQQWEHRPVSFRFKAPSEERVLVVIRGLNNTSAIAVDGIPVVVLKLLAPIIAGPISHLIKMSFEYAMVPSGFKRAIVLPLHKKNKPAHLSSS